MAMATTPDATGDIDLTGEPRAASARPPSRVPRRAPLPVAATVAAGWAAIVSFRPGLDFALLAQAGTAGGAGRVLHLAAAGWLLGHGVPVPAGSTQISLVPLAVTGLALWRLTRAGVHTARAIRARASARRAAL